MVGDDWGWLGWLGLVGGGLGGGGWLGVDGGGWRWWEVIGGDWVVYIHPFAIILTLLLTCLI